MDWLLTLLSNEREVDAGGRRSGELYLRLLGGIPHPLHGVPVALKIHTFRLLEFACYVIDEGVVHVQAAEASVPVGALHLEDALSDLHQGDVEGSPT